MQLKELNPLMSPAVLDIQECDTSQLYTNQAWEAFARQVKNLKM